MSIIVTCAQCRQKFAAADWLAGQQVRCTACGSPLTVPRPPAASPPPKKTSARPAGGGKIVVQCGSCGQAFRADAALAGRRVACSSCGQPISVPAASTAVAPVRAASDNPLSDLGNYTAPAAWRSPPTAA